MLINNFTAKRMETLNKMSFPDLSFPLGLRPIWIESVDAAAVKNSVLSIPHQHSFNEIHFILSGSATYRINGDDLTADCCQAIIIPSNIEHQLFSHDENLLKTTIAFACDEEIFKNPIPINFDDFTKNKLNEIFELCQDNNIFTPYVLCAMQTEILYAIMKNLSVLLPVAETQRHDPRFLVAKSFIEKRIDKKITITQVASECCLSEKQLNRIFHKETGSSVSGYINTVKINAAKKLLSQNTLSIKEICFALGFESTSSFIPFFKKHCSITPGDYRRQMSKN